MDLLRETTFGRLVRLTTRGKFLGHDDSSSLLLLEKNQNLQMQSTPSVFNEAFNVGDQESKGNENPAVESTTATSSPQNENGSSAAPKDPEKAGDQLLVDWAPDDPHNPRNWSTPKKLFVTFQICLLTTSVYIGSAIYTAGLPGIQQEFQISTVKALLGLTLFVLGYALGPMVWVCYLSAFPS